MEASAVERLPQGELRMTLDLPVSVEARDWLVYGTGLQLWKVESLATMDPLTAEQQALLAAPKAKKGMHNSLG